MTNPALSGEARREALEARVARLVASRLDEATSALPHDIGARLRFARERALAHVGQARVSAASMPVVGLSGGSAVLGGTPWWLKLASAAPILLLAGGLLLIQRLNDLQQIEAAAEVDAVLLADDLPPEAYADPGFGEFLKLPQP